MGGSYPSAEVQSVYSTAPHQPTSQKVNMSIKTDKYMYVCMCVCLCVSVCVRDFCLSIPFLFYILNIPFYKSFNLLKMSRLYISIDI